MKKLMTAIMFICLSVSFAHADTAFSRLEQTALEAGVTKETSSMLAARTQQAGFTPAEADAVARVISSMYKAGAQSAADKVLEGIAKNVAPARISGALNRVQSRFEKAMDVAVMSGVGEKNRERVAEMAAEAMAAGADFNHLSDLAVGINAKSSDTDEYAEAVISLYRDMVRHGTDAQKAHQSAKKAMGSFSYSQINGLRKEFSERAGYSDVNSLADRMSTNAEKGQAGLGGKGESSSGSSGSSGSGSDNSGGTGGSGGSGGNGGSGGQGGKH